MKNQPYFFVFISCIFFQFVGTASVTESTMRIEVSGIELILYKEIQYALYEGADFDLYTFSTRGNDILSLYVGNHPNLEFLGTEGKSNIANQLGLNSGEKQITNRQRLMQSRSVSLVWESLEGGFYGDHVIYLNERQPLPCFFHFHYEDVELAERELISGIIEQVRAQSRTEKGGAP